MVSEYLLNDYIFIVSRLFMYAVSFGEFSHCLAKKHEFFRPSRDIPAGIIFVRYLEVIPTCYSPSIYKFIGVVCSQYATKQSANYYYGFFVFMITLLLLNIHISLLKWQYVNTIKYVYILLSILWCYDSAFIILIEKAL